MRIAVLAALAVLVAAPVAAADPPWSAPRAASPAAGFLTAPGHVFARDGSGLLSWNTGEPARGHVSTLRADGTIVPRGRLGGEIVAKPLLRGGNRTVILTRKRRVTKGFRTLDTLTVRFGTTTSPRGRVRRVGGTHEVAGEDQGPALAVSGDEVAVAWVELLSHERHRYRIAFSRGGRAFSRPQTLATTVLPTRDSESIALAYGSGRKLIAAFSSARRKTGDHPVIAYRVRRPGHGFGGAHILGDRQPLTTLVAASNRVGRIVVAWGSQDSGEEASRPWVLRAAVRPGLSFGHTVVLDPGGTRDFAPGALVANMSADGVATVAWSNVGGSPGAETFPLRTATAVPGSPFGATTEITPNGVAGGLAVDHHRTLLTWTGGGDVFAALRFGGTGAFGAPELVSTGAVEDRDPAVAAFGAGRPTALWAARSDATHTRLQISSRAG